MSGPTNVVFSDALNYKTKPAAAPGEIKRQNVLNGRRSYVKFTLTSPDANAMAPDYTTDSMIESMELYHGSELIEQNSQYGALAYLVKDFRSNAKVEEMLEGQHLSTSRTGATVPAANGGTLQVCIKLLPGIIVTMHPKFPAYACSNGDLRPELTLASTASGLVNDTAVSAWMMSGAEMTLEYVEMSPAEIAWLPKDMSFSFESFESLSPTIPAGTTTSTRS
eukprot:jgi/Tetstr1/430338/TSEL_020163.t1